MKQNFHFLTIKRSNIGETLNIGDNIGDNDRPRGNNIEFFFLMSIFNVDFQCRIFQCLFLVLIFDVDFQCCFLTIIVNVFFFLFLFWDFFKIF